MVAWSEVAKLLWRSRIDADGLFGPKNKYEDKRRSIIAWAHIRRLL